jgi:hypothetical protein
MKVVVSEFKRTEKEIDLEYPIYLYYQDDFIEEHIMDNGVHQVKVIREPFSVSIKVERSEKYEEAYLRRNLTSKKHFLGEYLDALDYIRNIDKWENNSDEK